MKYFSEKKLNSKPRTKGESPKKKTKKRYNSDDSFDGSFSSDDGGSPHRTTPVPTRTVARRSAGKYNMLLIFNCLKCNLAYGLDIVIW